MKSIILAINAKYVHTALAPWCLLAAVRAHNAHADGRLGDAEADTLIAEPEVVESHINRPAEEILAAIVEARPDILAISCYIWNISLVERLAAELRRRLPECILILGGPEVSHNALERLEALPMVSYIICGEGEKAFVRLLCLLQRGLAGAEEGCQTQARAHATAEKTLAAIPGLAWRRGGKALQNPIRAESGAPPSPLLPEYLDRLTGRMAYLETSRGCPFRCSFCLSGQSAQACYFDLDEAKRGLLLLAGACPKVVKLVDRTSNSRVARCREFIRFILECRADGRIPAGVCYHMEVAADLFDRQSIDLLRSAPPGLFQLEIGLQSFNEHTLAAVGRKTNLARVSENTRLLRENNNIHLHLDLLVGLPEEGLASLAQSFDQAFALSPHMLQLGFLKLIHGSSLREQSRALGIEYEPAPPYRVRLTPWISEDEMDQLALCEDALNRLYNSGRFPRTCRYLLSEKHGLSPFTFFYTAGRFIGKSAGVPLDAYIARILDFGADLAVADPEALRDCLVMDWLATNPVGVLPLCLKRADLLNRRVARALEARYPRAKPDSQATQAAPSAQEATTVKTAQVTKRPFGFGLLYGACTTKVAVADYRFPRPILGDYPLAVVDAEKLC